MNDQNANNQRDDKSYRDGGYIPGPTGGVEVLPGDVILDPRNIAAKRRTGGRLPADDTNPANTIPANTIPFRRHPGEQFYSARDVQAITERKENKSP